MQTHLPYPEFEHSARVLDDELLRGQRLHVLQIMSALLSCRVSATDISGADLPREDWVVKPMAPMGWGQHPATLMWKGYEFSLLMYQSAICAEVTSRGFEDSYMAKTAALFHFNHHQLQGNAEPFWLEDEEFHITHQSNLIRKNHEFYAPLFPGVADDLDYIWPEEPW